MLDMHHIISDAVSMEIFIKELLDLYDKKELHPLHLQYKEFTVWQNKLFGTDEFKIQKQYWEDRFSGHLPVLKMPTDYPRPSVQSFKGDMIQFEIDKALTKELLAIETKTGATRYMVLLAVTSIILSKYSGQYDIIVGTPVAGRRHSESYNMIGFFVNVLLMRNYPEPAKSFEEFLEEVKENVLEAFENQDYQFDNLVEHLALERDKSRNPVYDVVFALENVEMPNLEIKELEIKPYEFENKTSKTDLRIGVVERGDTIGMCITYATALFKKETAERMAQHYIEIIKQIVENNKIKLENIKIFYDLIAIKPNILREDESEFNF
jgi:hypothetical protein